MTFAESHAISKRARIRQPSCTKFGEHLTEENGLLNCWRASVKRHENSQRGYNWVTVSNALHRNSDRQSKSRWSNNQLGNLTTMRSRTGGKSLRMLEF